MFDGENWSALSIWIDQHISEPFSVPLGIWIVAGYAVMFVIAMVGLGDATRDYFKR